MAVERDRKKKARRPEKNSVRLSLSLLQDYLWNQPRSTRSLGRNFRLAGAAGRSRSLGAGLNWDHADWAAADPYYGAYGRTAAAADPFLMAEEERRGKFNGPIFIRCTFGAVPAFPSSELKVKSSGLISISSSMQ